jgi:hypothetical protein
MTDIDVVKRENVGVFGSGETTFLLDPWFEGDPNM